MPATSSSSAALHEIAELTRQISAAVRPSVVSIGRMGRGTGIVIGENRVLTNAHNLRDQTTLVTFADGRSVQGEVAGVDADGDLAVLTVETAGTPLIAASERELEEGDIVFAVSAGGQRARTTWGLITGVDRTFRGPRGRRIGHSLEHTAPLPRGSSGGPLVDTDGRLVAINTHRVDSGAFYLARRTTADLQARIADLAAGVEPKPLSLGVALAPSHVAARLRQAVGLEARHGQLVRGVAPESAAARAGVQRGDLLVRAGGRELESLDDLFDVLASHDVAATLTLLVVRGADELPIEVSFIEADRGRVWSSPDGDDGDDFGSGRGPRGRGGRWGQSGPWGPGGPGGRGGRGGPGGWRGPGGHRG